MGASIPFVELILSAFDANVILRNNLDVKSVEIGKLSEQ